jgi:hypothetical protein
VKSSYRRRDAPSPGTRRGHRARRRGSPARRSDREPVATPIHRALCGPCTARRRPDTRRCCEDRAPTIRARRAGWPRAPGSHAPVPDDES